MKLLPTRKPKPACWVCGTTGTIRNPVRGAHIIPTRDGGSSDPSNLEQMCALHFAQRPPR